MCWACPAAFARDEDDAADGLAADLSGVVLEETVVASRAGEVDCLVLIERADGADNLADDATVEGSLRRGVVGEPAGGIAA
jgi:hypothetical protein